MFKKKMVAYVDRYRTQPYNPALWACHPCGAVGLLGPAGCAASGPEVSGLPLSGRKAEVKGADRLDRYGIRPYTPARAPVACAYNPCGRWLTYGTAGFRSAVSGLWGHQVIGPAGCGASRLWGQQAIAQAATGQRAAGQRANGQRVIGQRGVGQRTMGQRASGPAGQQAMGRQAIGQDWSGGSRSVVCRSCRRDFALVAPFGGSTPSRSSRQCMHSSHREARRCGARGSYNDACTTARGTTCAATGADDMRRRGRRAEPAFACARRKDMRNCM